MNNGTPIGTVMDIACRTLPVRIPRRSVAVLRPNNAADTSERSAPNS